MFNNFGIASDMFAGWGSRTPRKPAQSDSDDKSNNKLQEGSLGLVIDRDGDAPQILSLLIRFVQTVGIVEGIFQTQPPQGKELQTLRRQLKTDPQEVKVVSQYTKNPHVIAELIKQLLASLPEPLVPYEMYDRFMLVTTIKLHEERMTIIRQLLTRLPKGYHSTLSMLLRLLSSICAEPDTKTDAATLAQIFAPWILRPSFRVFYREVDEENRVHIATLLISEYEYLFKNGKLASGDFPALNIQLPKMIAPQLPRQASLRFLDISSSNQHRKPTYYLQQVKNYKEALQASTTKGSPELDAVTPQLDQTLTPNVPSENPSQPSTPATPFDQEEEIDLESDSSSSSEEELIDSIDDTGYENNAIQIEPEILQDDTNKEEVSLNEERLLLISSTDSDPVMVKPPQSVDDLSNEFELLQPETEEHTEPVQNDTNEVFEEDTFDDVAVSILLPNSPAAPTPSRPVPR